MLAATVLLASVGGWLPSAAEPVVPPVQPRSTPVPIATPEGRLSGYVVNTRQVGAGLREVRRAVRRAEGEVVQAWRPIGVLVVHSTSATFRRDVQRVAGRRVVSVGATRAAAVSEGVPGAAAVERSGGTQSLRIDDPGQVLVADPGRTSSGTWS